MVLLSCHEDLVGEGALEPDWLYEMRPAKLRAWNLDPRTKAVRTLGIISFHWSSWKAPPTNTMGWTRGQLRSFICVQASREAPTPREMAMTPTAFPVRSCKYFTPFPNTNLLVHIDGCNAW